LLSDYFQVPARLAQLRGSWRYLDLEQWTRLGTTGQNQRLGQGAVLGTRVWDQQAKFEVILGPMKLDQFRDFLPTGSAYAPLCDLTRFYAGSAVDFSIRLTLVASEVSGFRLGQSQLGWTTWLKTETTRLLQDDSQVLLTVRSPQS